MSVTLQLKRRPDAAVISLNYQALVSLMAQPAEAKEKLWSLMKALTSAPATRHDKEWLEYIVNYVPQDGLKMTDMARWLKLAERVARLDDQREGPFTLSPSQAELIYSRLNDDKFVSRQTSPAFAGFLLHFFDKMGKRPASLTDDDLYDEPEALGLPETTPETQKESALGAL